MTCVPSCSFPVCIFISTATVVISLCKCFWCISLILYVMRFNRFGIWSSCVYPWGSLLLLLCILFVINNLKKLKTNPTGKSFLKPAYSSLMRYKLVLQLAQKFLECQIKVNKLQTQTHKHKAVSVCTSMRMQPCCGHFEGEGHCCLRVDLEAAIAFWLMVRHLFYVLRCFWGVLGQFMADES